MVVVERVVVDQGETEHEREAEKKCVEQFMRRQKNGGTKEGLSGIVNQLLRAARMDGRTNGGTKGRLEVPRAPGLGIRVGIT